MKLSNYLNQTGMGLALIMVAACGGGDGDGAEGFENSELAPTIIANFTDEVVVSTYQLLAERAATLHTTVAALQEQPTDSNLTAAQNAWKDTREPWESSEGFLFGPVDSYGFDPALDSWPVDKTSLDGVLGSGDDLTQTYVASLDDTLQGFHTAEYLLFGADGTASATDLSDRELEYLGSVVTEMAGLADNLALAWTDGIEGSDPYADVFRTAGEDDNTVYPSYQAAGQEIVYGMIGILDEVANGKIADPFVEQDTTLVESQFSHNSLTDFSNNIRSVQNAYLGKNMATGQTATGFNQFVAEVDADLDARLQSELEASLTALAAIPEPFRDAILDPNSEGLILAAQEAIRTVQTSLETDVLPLVSN